MHHIIQHIKVSAAPPPRNAFAELQAWYAKQCDGQWELAYGINIQTNEKRGWRVLIDLAWTPLDGRPFEPVDKREKEKWFRCQVTDDKFVGTCDLYSLDELVLTFVDWARDSE